MKLKFNKQYWTKKLSHPDWYILLEKDLEELFFPVVHDDPTLKTFRNKIYDLVQGMLEEHQIPLAKKGPNFDAQRKNIDTIIIHHTEEDPIMLPEKISAIGLLRLYAPKYIKNDVLGHKLQGEPIWSGHFYKDHQVFFGYHWYVYPDGKQEQLLPDQAIGWHSGVWDINARSIGIALSGNYEHTSPPLSQIKNVAEIIIEKYPYITKDSIVGHREIKQGRTCPGDTFLPQWKQQLLRLL